MFLVESLELSTPDLWRVFGEISWNSSFSWRAEIGKALLSNNVQRVKMSVTLHFEKMEYNIKEDQTSIRQRRVIWLCYEFTKYYIYLGAYFLEHVDVMVR